MRLHRDKRARTRAGHVRSMEVSEEEEEEGLEEASHKEMGSRKPLLLAGESLLLFWEFCKVECLQDVHISKSRYGAGCSEQPPISRLFSQTNKLILAGGVIGGLKSGLKPVGNPTKNKSPASGVGQVRSKQQGGRGGRGKEAPCPWASCQLPDCHCSLCSTSGPGSPPQTLLFCQIPPAALSPSGALYSPRGLVC
eukprot:367516-Pelagomonas_calceolata.AAC.5